VFGARADEAAGNMPQFVAGMRTAFIMGGAAELCGALIAAAWFRRRSLETVDGRAAARHV
jgi:hypothetical protein